MKKIQAVGVGVLGMALSATAALAAAPPSSTPSIAPNDSSASSRAPAVSNDKAPDTRHGAVVSVIATDSALVGGKHDNHGGAVSAVARGTHGPSVPATGPAPSGVKHAVSAGHGPTVSAVAKDVSQVGGKNDNHGGAVSAVARGSHGQGSVHP